MRECDLSPLNRLPRDLRCQPIAVAQLSGFQEGIDALGFSWGGQGFIHRPRALAQTVLG